MHNEVRVRNLGVNFFDAANRENVAGRRAAEFISTVACAYRDGESVDAGRINEVFGFLRVG